jgi:rhamnosyltransferase
MKLLGIATAYHPKIEELIRNINTYISELDQLIIWDNTPGGSSSLDDAVKSENNPKIIIRCTGNNEYLAKPFNICIKEGIENGYTHILTMDQDSYFESNGFSEFVSKVEANTDSLTMAFCPAKTENQPIDSNEMEVDNTITSGTIYKVDVFEKIGYFREDFLIYMIDIEFGMRVKKYGYKILCYPRILLNHFTGYTKKNILGFRIDNYSAQSTYYIIRNVILNWSLYPEKFDQKEKLTFYRYKIVYRTLKVFFEPQPLKKLKAIYLGLLHGLTGKSGIYNL